MSRTLSGLFLVGALNRLRKRKRTNRENPQTIPAQIGKIPEKSRKSEKGQKRKESGKPPFETPPYVCFASLSEGSVGPFLFKPPVRALAERTHLV